MVLLFAILCGNINLQTWFLYIYMILFYLQVDGGIILPDKASLYLTAIEDAEYKDDKIECI